jgi:chromosomal replication initiation ATPase DnaA
MKSYLENLTNSALTVSPAAHNPKTHLEQIINIINHVCFTFGVKTKYLFSPDRREHVANARFLCFHLLKQCLDLPDSEIGDLFERTKNLVTHGRKSIQDRMSIYPDFHQQVIYMEIEIKARFHPIPARRSPCGTKD